MLLKVININQAQPLSVLSTFIVNEKIFNIETH